MKQQKQQLLFIEEDTRTIAFAGGETYLCMSSWWGSAKRLGPARSCELSSQNATACLVHLALTALSADGLRSEINAILPNCHVLICLFVVAEPHTAGM